VHVFALEARVDMVQQTGGGNRVGIEDSDDLIADLAAALDATRPV